MAVLVIDFSQKVNAYLMFQDFSPYIEPIQFLKSLALSMIIYLHLRTKANENNLGI